MKQNGAKIGVYVCHCGSNIAGVVDVGQVVEYAQGLPCVTLSKDYVYMCSDPGQNMIKEDIKQEGLDRVVVACCSPSLHENTFRRACHEAGLNPYLFQQANIREQCSWVTEDKAMATEKAKALVSGAVSRVAYQEALESREVDINPNTLVIGGGIAGIQAALEIADAGHRVYLVERTPSIGGHMAQLDKTFPTLDCSSCILTPKMTLVGSHPNIELMTYSEVDEISGYIGNFKAKIRKKARYIDEEKCTGCGVCQTKCPYKVDSEFEAGVGKRKVIYTPFAQAVPNVPVIDAEHCVYFSKGTCRACEKFCDPKAVDFEQKDQTIEVDVGSVIVTTGYQVFDPQPMAHYGYGRLDNVVTSLEFERMVSSAGPTGGKIQLKDGTVPTSIAIAHCIGSRDEKYHEYCSRVCCMYALKYSHLIKEKTEANVYQMYIDMRCFGKGYEEFYKRLGHEGVKFIRGKIAGITDEAISSEEEGKLVVLAEDSLLGTVLRVPVDMVILCVALEPQADAEEVARKLNVSRSADGFYLERHPKLDPVATATDGVFVAGCCQGPKDIPDTVAQASAAAARVLSMISRGKMEVEAATAVVNEDLCSGCRVCNELCAFSAISFDQEKKISEINDALCKGCGVCVAACPSGAITGRHFTTTQVIAEIEGVLA